MVRSDVSRNAYSYAVVYAAPMIGMGLTAIRQLQCIYRRIKALKNHEEVTEA